MAARAAIVDLRGSECDVVPGGGDQQPGGAGDVQPGDAFDAGASKAAKAHFVLAITRGGSHIDIAPGDCD